jgi:phenylalanine-4-hydroxylase
LRNEGKTNLHTNYGENSISSREKKELVGHGTLTHPDGFGSPIGKTNQPAIEDMSPKDLNAYDILESKTVKLEFEGGITVEGEIVTGSRNLQGEIILIVLKLYCDTW